MIKVRPAAGLVLLGLLSLTACGGGESATARAHDQAVQACDEARNGGASSALAVVHAHQAAGLDPSYSALANDFAQVAVTQESFGADLGAGEDATDGTSALQALSAGCATLGVTVSATAPQTGVALP